jgi:[DsrC]-trisulfide reductase subunit J
MFTGALIVGLGMLAVLAAAPLPAEAGRVPLPSHPEALKKFSATQDCVEPTDVMRRNHMKLILHQRDETMHLGIRTKRHSLAECVACHVSRDKAGKYLPVNGPGEFCESCHEYAAVEIDCFQCHATVPRQAKFDVLEREHKIPREHSTSASGMSSPGEAR